MHDRDCEIFLYHGTHLLHLKPSQPLHLNGGVLHSMFSYDENKTKEKIKKYPTNLATLSIYV